MSANSTRSVPPRKASTESKIAQALTTKSKSKLSGTEQFLRLELSNKTRALLPIRQLSEVLKVPADRVAPIPHMPSWLMGVYNWRGQILWMVDLAHLVGLVPWHQQNLNVSTHTVVVFNPLSSRTKTSNQQSQMLGLVVNRVTDLESCDPHMIQPPAATSTQSFTQFLRGYWMKSEDDVLAVLSGDAILGAMPKG
ncbi:MAG: chemotaxis protein CheW [Elainellaceae cyanobacterium]